MKPDRLDNLLAAYAAQPLPPSLGTFNHGGLA